MKGISSLERPINYVNKKYPKVFTIADAKRGDMETLQVGMPKHILINLVLIQLQYLPIWEKIQ